MNTIILVDKKGFKHAITFHDTPPKLKIPIARSLIDVTWDTPLSKFDEPLVSSYLVFEKWRRIDEEVWEYREER
jgi:hypothetical protein